MRRALLCLALMMATGPAFAATDAWTAQMQDDEGGSLMVASIDGQADGNVKPSLEFECAGKQGVSLRYLTTADTVQPGSEADFIFENESTQAKKHMQYEDMDGAFAAYFPPNDPLVTLLENGDDVFVSESSGNYPAQSFHLKGSTKAINTVLKTCKK